MSEHFDVCIIGGGVMGAAAAWRCASAGLTVILLEASPTPTHATGSSHGHSRIVRKTYADPVYARLMMAAYPLWDEASLAAGCGPLRPPHDGSPSPPPLVAFMGGLSIVDAGSPQHTGLLASASACGVSVAAVAPAEASTRWGLRLPPGALVLEEGADTGVAVGAGRCVAALQALAVGLGAELRCDAEVVGVAAARGVAGGDGWGVRVTVRGGGAAVHAKRCVLCPGAWAGPLVETVCRRALPLTPWLCSTGYYRLAGAQAAAAVARAAAAVGENHGGKEALPVIISWREGSAPVYGCPVTAGTEEAAAWGVDAFKFAVHRGAPTTAAGRPFSPAEEVTVEPVAEWLREYLPGAVEPTPLPGSLTTCLYTMTPDEDFVLDAMPLFEEGREGGSSGGGGGASSDGNESAGVHGLCFLAGGFSGHGFKFAPLIGEIARMWVLESLFEEPSAGWEEGEASSVALHRVETMLQEAVEAAGGGGGGEALLAKFSARRFK